MIQRYSRKEMAKIFTDQAKFDAWLKVECYATEAFGKLGIISKEEVTDLVSNANYDIERVFELERETRHDVVAFTRAVGEKLGPEKKWLHYGLTSTDVVDTAFGYLYKQANDLLRADIDLFLEVLKVQAIRYRDTPCIGRTHGIHADITSFGLKWALWYDEMSRNKQRFEQAARELEIGKISGAVGNFANTDPFVQNYVCEQLGIQSSKISTQTLQRDRHAYYMATIALIASSIEKIALEIRHLQRTEVQEVEEFFRKGQKGSSAMPHKRNPISSENMAGCARVMRGYMTPAYEDIALWHERDISHSSAERIIFPDAIILLDYMLSRYTQVLDNLIVYPERMLANIELTHGVIYSQQVMNRLIETAKLSREEAYDLIQPLALKSYTEKMDFKELLLNSSEILSYLSKEEIADAFKLEHFLRSVNIIYQRVGLI